MCTLFIVTTQQLGKHVPAATNTFLIIPFYSQSPPIHSENCVKTKITVSRRVRGSIRPLPLRLNVVLLNQLSTGTALILPLM
jgi:hypothetical protein